MARSTQLAVLFRCPPLVAQRNYEICKAYYLDKTPAEQLAARFGLHPDSVRAIVRDFAHAPQRDRFFVVNRPGRQTAPKRDALTDDIRQLRREGLTLVPIQQRLQEQGHSISESYVSRLLAEQGLADSPLTARQPAIVRQAKDGADIPAAADVRLGSFAPGRCFHTKAAGLFLFVPLLLALDLPAAVQQAGWPGWRLIPSLQAILALLTANLLGKRRISHIDDLCTDEGAGLFSDLNVLPKTTFATDHSYRTDRGMKERFIDALVSKAPLGEGPHRFNLDFHAIAFGGNDTDLEKHWLAKRNRAGPAVMAVVAQHIKRRLMCYATANVLRNEADQMAVRFADHGKEQTGNYPERLFFDGRVTT